MNHLLLILLAVVVVVPVAVLVAFVGIRGHLWLEEWAERRRRDRAWRR